MNELKQLIQKANLELSKLQKIADINNLKSQYFGKAGIIQNLMKDLKDKTLEEKKILGAQINEFKNELDKMFTQFLEKIELEEMNQNLLKDKIDLTLTDSIMDHGLQAAGLHPVNSVQREIEDVFISMGFEILDGPHIEDEYHNFEALNIPATHPARDMQDTFWFGDKKHLLRTHTSTIQVRGMKGRKPPFRFVGPGKVFRCERTDASHEIVFHQLEGMMVGTDVSVSNLIYFMKTLLSEIFKKDVKIRLRPGFFPFVEPGFELDINCLICNGMGCPVCKQVGWVELLPCGMVHPEVLRLGGIDPEINSGFAFGLGLDRLVMMKYGIDDIRLIHSGDLRFSEQFKTY